MPQLLVLGVQPVDDLLPVGRPLVLAPDRLRERRQLPGELLGLTRELLGGVGKTGIVRERGRWTFPETGSRGSLGRGAIYLLVPETCEFLTSATLAIKDPARERFRCPLVSRMS